MPQGTLFTEDFLNEGIRGTEAWRSITPEALAAFRKVLQAIVKDVADPPRLNEAQTEDRIVKPILQSLGWDGCYWVQERLETKGRANVPDYLFFGTPEDFAQADRRRTASERYPLAIAVGDAKAWAIDLDRRGSGAGADETPSGQILRYLSRAETQSDRKVRWGCLTNGRYWRLYYQGAKSRLEEFFEIDIGWVLAVPGTQGDLDVSVRPPVFQSDGAWREHLLTLFWLMFRRDAFLPSADGRTFHQIALAEGREWEAKVRQNLASVVFEGVFPDLLRALVRADVQAPNPVTAAYLATLREAALTLLYRLLFALYAEDRDLLPKRDPNYGGLSRLRDEVAERVDAGTKLSGRRKTYAGVCAQLFVTIDEGDDTLGVPPYNGGLFSDKTPATELLDRAVLPDADFAPLLDRLARTEKAGRRVRINFRDLSVQQLGSIYERLLEHEPIVAPDKPAGIDVRLNPFARKGSGSYYTPDELVKLIIERTIGPLVEEKHAAFIKRASELAGDRRRVEIRLEELYKLDPAEAVLNLKVVDPAMGSGHFLVSLVDYLAERVITLMIEARHEVAWTDYVSPLVRRLADVWARIRAEAEAHGWIIRDDQLADKNLIKRFVLKRCVYGVDKNPMAVELAKVALWLHTFTAGAPLSFLDHHLKCGDSLYGEWVRKALDELAAENTLFISDAVRKAEGAIAGMHRIEDWSDVDIAEVKASAHEFEGVQQRTEPLRRFLDFWHARKWLELTDDEKAALRATLDGAFGPSLAVLGGLQPPDRPAHLTDEALKLFHEGGAEQLQMREFGGAGTARDYLALSGLIRRAHERAAEQKFLHWQIAFPGVWRNWTSAEPDGGFDAVIGNPPWDRMKMQEVEWFAARAPEVAHQARAADRKRLIAKMKAAGDPLIAQYERASSLAETAMERARRGGDYPLLSRGDINVYSLFVERAQALIKPDGIAGLLTPSGIASDFGASAFFRKVATAGRVQCLFDFENRGIFFPDVHNSFKFCTFICGGPKRVFPKTECAFFLHSSPEEASAEQLFSLTPKDFLLVNPNTGTAPIFRTKRDAELTTAIYRRLPVLVDHSNGAEKKTWPVRYLRMFDMTNDSHLFWTRERLEKEGAYPSDLGRWRKGEREWVPLYVGRMIHQFNHRAASVEVSDENVFNPATSDTTSITDLSKPDYVPDAQYWIRSDDVVWPYPHEWGFAFRDIARATDVRTAIGALVPKSGFGNKAPLLATDEMGTLCPIAANFNAIVFDFVCRSKVMSTSLNWFIVEQLPVLMPKQYEFRFGKQSAAEIIKDHVLRLTYTARDMAPFARDMGYVNKDGTVKPPIIWNEAERRHLRARLDALYFILYGVTDEDDIRYILSTFPIVERKDREAFDGIYLTRELILWYKRALEAGDPDTLAPEAEVIRLAKARKAD